MTANLGRKITQIIVYNKYHHEQGEKKAADLQTHDSLSSLVLSIICCCEFSCGGLETCLNLSGHVCFSEIWLKRLLLRPREEERLFDPTPVNSKSGELRPTADAMIGGGQPPWPP